MKTISFDGQVAVVTGSGRGIGRAEVVDLSRRGAAVVVNDVRKDDVNSVVDEIIAFGGTAIPSYESVSEPEGAARVIESAIERLGGIDILVNNAGIARPNYFENLSIDEIDSVIDTNLRGSFYITQPAWRHMKRQGYGRIVNTSSGVGMFSNHAQSNYAATKAAAYGFTKALAFEGLECGIHVNTILPLADSRMNDAGPIPDVELYTERYLGASRVALASRSRPVELVANMVTYLVSRECDITGEAYSCGYGRYSKVFVGVSQGWLSPGDDTVNAEAIGDNIQNIRSIDNFTVPAWFWDELVSIAKQLSAQ